MSSYGQQRLERVGKSIQLTADGAPKAKAGGITILWAAVAAASADFAVRPTGETSSGGSGYYEQNPSDDYVYAGDKFLRYGTIMCKIVGGAQAGKFAPYGTTVGSGNTIADATSLSIAKGDVYALNYSVHEYELGSDHLGAAIDGGRIFAARALVVGINPNAAAEATALGLVAAMPRADFEAVLPNFTYALD